MNGVSNYVENVAVTKACATFDEVTVVVFDTVRRLSVILICCSVARNSPVHISNAFGTFLVLAGGLLYQVESSSRNSNRELEDFDTQSTEERGVYN